LLCSIFILVTNLAEQHNMVTVKQSSSLLHISPVEKFSEPNLQRFGSPRLNRLSEDIKSLSLSIKIQEVAENVTLYRINWAQCLCVCDLHNTVFPLHDMEPLEVLA
jgi:hypothetical protein